MKILVNSLGEKKKIPKGFNWWAFWFCPLYFLYKGMVAPFFRWWIINTFMIILTLGFWFFIAPIVVGFTYEKIATEYWTEKGYVLLVEQGEGKA